MAGRVTPWEWGERCHVLNKEKAEEYELLGLILRTGPGDILGDTGAGPPPSMKLLLYQTLLPDLQSPALSQASRTGSSLETRKGTPIWIPGN